MTVSYLVNSRTKLKVFTIRKYNQPLYQTPHIAHKQTNVTKPQRNLTLPYLSETGSGLLDGDLALVLHSGPHTDGLAGHVTSSVQSHAAGDRATRQTRHAQVVLDLAMEGLL